MLFSEKLLREAAESNVFREGRRYFLDGAVKTLTIQRASNKNIEIQGTVEGRERYQTRLVFSPEAERLVFYDCSCPYQWDVCKHAVALGLTSLLHEVGTTLSGDDLARRGDVIAALAKANGVPLRPGEASSLVAPVVEKKIVSAAPSRMNRLNLDEVIIRVRYETEADQIFVRSTARYGSYELLLGDEEAKERYERIEGDHKVVDQISRLLSTEEEALQSISRILKSERSPETNEWVVPSPRILLFVSNSLEALRELGRVELDPSAERMLTVQPADIEWDVQVTPTTGIDWFSFSFDWHCEQSALDPAMLKQAMGSDEPIIRLPDGRIVRIQNNDELQALLGWMNESGTSDAKTVRVRRYHVPELLFLTQSTRHTHFQQTDDAFQRFMQDVSRGDISEPPILTPLLAKTLRPYQRDGVQWLQFLHRYGFGGVLADEMGLGKTVQVLAFLSSLQQLKKTPAPALIVCPKTLLTVWHEEAARFTPDLRMLVIDGTPEERKQKLQGWQNADVVLTSYSFLQRDVAQYLEAKATFSVCVIDEAQFIKNARTQTSVVIKSIPSAFRIALTGTPIENGVQELWSLFDFLMPGFLGQTREFTEQYTRPIRERQDEQALARLRFKLKPFLLRRTKDVVAKELPPKIEQEVRCTLSPEQLVLYSRTLSEVRTEVQDLVAQKGFNRSQIEILAALTKLRRICDHPSFADSSLGGDVSLSGKLETTIELIHEALAGGHKILVFSQFTSMLDLVRNALDQEKIESVTIEGSTRDRGAEIQRFRAGVSVFLLSLKAGGTGLTLTEADTVILIDPWWNPQVEKQAMDRAHRIGQTRPVTVYKLVSQQTIEERMIELQKKKQHIFDAMLEGSATTMESLTLSDIEAVLG